MSFSLGGVVGALLYGSFGHHSHPRRAFAVAMWGSAITLIAFAIWPQTGVMIGAALVGGVLLGPMNPVINLALQRRTPERMRGRAMGIVIALAYGAYPIGYVLAGVLVESFGVVTTMATFAVANVVIALLAMAAPSLKRLDEEPLLESSVPALV
jgi:MFS family permease